MFDVSNWQSTIRDLVRVHPDYSQISRWPGQWETADLIYDDFSGGFTKVLIECGYLDGSWEGCTPNYLLEVKTTTGQCETPFFMSQAQYERVGPKPLFCRQSCYLNGSGLTRRPIVVEPPQ
jgi:hypothetical protein